MARHLVPGLVVVVLIGATAGCGTVAPVRATGSPAVRSAAPSRSPSPEATAPAPTAPPDLAHVFPVAGQADYGRTHHDYPATDVFAKCGSPVRAVTAGVVLEVERVDRFKIDDPLGVDKGGMSVSIKGDDGVRYYGSHLSAVSAGIGAGIHVKAGADIGKVGRTGNASNVCHLHFGISPVCQGTGDWWTRRGVVYPWRYLDSWKGGENLSPADEIAGWQREHGCPSSPPGGER
jgi:murein DD-endopeptidase MepM/ murein hydrolase activator NlpD